MIGRRELMHVGANFGQNNLNGGGAEAIHFKQINASDAAKMNLGGHMSGPMIKVQKSAE
jgi:hypothetical protein